MSSRRITHPLTHPRGCGFRYDKRRCVLYNAATKRLMPGITKSNASLFYPRYTYNSATHTTSIAGTFASTVSNCSHSDRLVVGRYSRLTAVKRGTLLDTQIERTTRYFKKYKLQHSYFYDAEDRDAWTKTVVPIATKNYIARLIPHTRACWLTMSKLQLAPVACQVVVGCATMNRATMIDLVCIDMSCSIKTYVPIEIKSGFNNYYYNCTNFKMAAPFQQQSDCVFNQHQLQLLIGSELYRRSYWKDDKSKMGVPLLIRFRTDDDNNVVSDVHPLRQWAIDALPAAVVSIIRS